jgi:ubiquinone/menaquinone biosynthesis C-methylase UbiE
MTSPPAAQQPGPLRRVWVQSIRTLFRLLYGPAAWTYDAVAWLVSMGQWTDWVRLAVRFLEEPAVLELGHGPGHLQAELAEAELAPVGIDVSSQMGRLAQRRLRRAGVTPRLVQARAQALPFPSDTFSDTVATFPTEYILDPATLAEVRRVLDQQGRLVVVASGRLTGRDPMSRLLEWLYRITGQRAPVPRGDEFTPSQSGLALESEWVPARWSQVLVVLGRQVEPTATEDDRSE